MASHRNNSKSKDIDMNLNNAYSTYNFPNTLNNRNSLETMVTSKTDNFMRTTLGDNQNS